MLEKLGRLIKVPMSMPEWLLVPKHGGYKWEYVSGKAEISPGWRTHSAMLDLARWEDDPGDLRPAGCEFRAIQAADWSALVETFLWACCRVPPLELLTEAQYAEAAKQLIDHTRSGGDGEVITDASFVALEAATSKIVGAALVTLNRAHDFEEGVRPKDPEPRLTWIFVSGMRRREGIASFLLQHVVQALRAAGHKTLHSNIAYGNDASVAFHWRSGFKLRADGFSRRRFRRKAVD